VSMKLQATIRICVGSMMRPDYSLIPTRNQNGLCIVRLSLSALETNDNDDIINDSAKWNNLYFVSLYDHLYQRGYVDSITDSYEFLGETAMCGCVEDMPAVARADCTEAIGHANYTVYQDQETGMLQINYKEDTFEIEFRACEGWQYKDDITPEQYQEAADIHRLGLRRQNNDLSALVFKQYLEGKTSTKFTDEYEKTVVGYKYPEVNQNDAQREKVCRAAFEENSQIKHGRNTSLKKKRRRNWMYKNMNLQSQPTKLQMNRG